VLAASQLSAAHLLTREFLLAADALLFLAAAETLLQCGDPAGRTWPCMALRGASVQAAGQRLTADVATGPVPRVAALRRGRLLAATVAAARGANCCALGAWAWMAQLGARVRAPSIPPANLAATMRCKMWAWLRLQHLLTEAGVLRQGANLVVAAPRTRPSELWPVTVAGTPHPKVDALQMEGRKTLGTRKNRAGARDLVQANHTFVSRPAQLICELLHC